jgi:hypothetical protein
MTRAAAARGFVKGSGEKRKSAAGVISLVTAFAFLTTRVLTGSTEPMHSSAVTVASCSPRRRSTTAATAATGGVRRIPSQTPAAALSASAAPETIHVRSLGNRPSATTTPAESSATDVAIRTCWMLERERSRRRH